MFHEHALPEGRLVMPMQFCSCLDVVTEQNAHASSVQGDNSGSYSAIHARAQRMSAELV